MKLTKGHRYVAATGKVVDGYDATAKAWKPLASPFCCTGDPIASSKVPNDPYVGNQLVPVALPDKSTHYVKGDVAADATNWDLADRPVEGRSTVAEPDKKTGKPTKKMLNNVDANLTPFDVGGGNGAKMAGFGLDARDTSGHTARLRTEVSWGAKVPGFVQAEGSKMEAHRLGPDHPMGRDPTDHTRVNSNALTKKTPGQDWIAGHMLNDNLGGTGDDPMNIIAIPMYMNGLHKNAVENDLKDTVNRDGKWVYYKLEVTDWHRTGGTNKEGQTQQYAKTFETVWYELDHVGNRNGNEHKHTFSVPELKDLNTAVTKAVKDEDPSAFLKDNSGGQPAAPDFMYSGVTTGAVEGAPFEKRSLMKGTTSFPAEPTVDPVDQVLGKATTMTHRSQSTALELKKEKIDMDQPDLGKDVELTKAKRRLNADDRGKVREVLNEQHTKPNSEMGKVLRGIAMDEAVQSFDANSKTGNKKQKKAAPPEYLVDEYRQNDDYLWYQRLQVFKERDPSSLKEQFAHLRDTFAVGVDEDTLWLTLETAYQGHGANVTGSKFISDVATNRSSYIGPDDLVTWMATEYA